MWACKWDFKAVQEMWQVRKACRGWVVEPLSTSAEDVIQTSNLLNILMFYTLTCWNFQ